MRDTNPLEISKKACEAKNTPGSAAFVKCLSSKIEAEQRASLGLTISDGKFVPNADDGKRSGKEKHALFISTRPTPCGGAVLELSTAHWSARASSLPRAYLEPSLSPH